MSSDRAVIDQPGMRIFILGLAFAVFVGLVIRSQLRPTKIAERINPLLQKINSNESGTILDFDHAEIRLSDWGLPRPILIVHNLRYSRNLNSCRAEQVQVRQVAIPIAISHLFSPELVMNTISLSDVEWRLPRTGRCQNSDGRTAEVSEPLLIETQSEGLQEDHLPSRANYFKYFKQIQSVTQSLRINRFRIIHAVDPTKNFELRNISLGFKNQGDQSVGLFNAQIFAVPDPITGALLFRSDISGEAIANPTQIQNSTLQINFDGRLIDRPVQFKIIYSAASDSLDLKGSLKSILIKRLLGLYQELPPNLNWMQQLNEFSLSSELDFSYSLLKRNWTKQLLSNVSLRHSDSSIELNDADLLKWLSKNRFELTLVAAQVNLKTFVKTFERGLGQVHVLNPGLFSGLIEISNFGDLTSTGVIRNVEFEFSNNSRKKIQIIDSMNARLEYSNSKTQIRISDLTTGSRRVSGAVQIKMDESENSKRLEIQGELKGPLLKSDSWKFLTGKDQDVDTLIRFKLMPDGSEVLAVQADKVELYGVELEKPSFEIVFDRELRPKQVKGIVRSATLLALLDEAEEKPLQMAFMTQLTRDLNVAPPIRAQGIDFSYTFTPQYQLQIQSFSNQKNIKSLRQIGQLKNLNVWTIESTLKTDVGLKQFNYDLNFATNQIRTEN